MIRIMFIFFISVAAHAGDYESLIKKFDMQREQGDKAVSSYLLERMEYSNSIKLDESGGCYSKSVKPINQIIRINKAGVVDLVVSDIENEMSECFKRLYLGSRYSPPPTSPIFEKMRMGRSVEEKVALIKEKIYESCLNASYARGDEEAHRLKYCGCTMDIFNQELSDIDFINATKPGASMSSVSAMKIAMDV